MKSIKTVSRNGGEKSRNTGTEIKSIEKKFFWTVSKRYHPE